MLRKGQKKQSLMHGVQIGWPQLDVKVGFQAVFLVSYQPKGIGHPADETVPGI